MSTSFTSMIPRYCGTSRNSIRSRNSDERFNRKKQNSTLERKIVPVHENVLERFLGNVITHLPLSALKTARLVCKKWNLIIFPVLVENTCVAFTGENARFSPSANDFTEFVRATPREGSCKIRCAIIKTNGEASIPAPYAIPWPYMRIRNATHYELTPWIHHSHLVNITRLELQRIALSPAMLFIYVRQFTNLREFRDISLNYMCPPEVRQAMDNEDFSCKALKFRTNTYREHRRNEEEIFVKCPRIKQPLTHVEIRRSQLEDITLSLKLLQLLNCQELISLKLIAVDTFISSSFVDTKRRAQDIKVDLYKNLTVVLNNNRETLTEVKLAFRHTSMEGWFDLAANHFEDRKSNLYQPELAQFFAYVNHFGWKSIQMVSLANLSIEFENKRRLTDEEANNFSSFLKSLPKLKTLKISNLLFSSATYPYILKVMELFQDSVPQNCICEFQTLYRDTWMNILPQEVASKFANSLTAIMILSEPPIVTKYSCATLNTSMVNNNEDKELVRRTFPSVKYLWYGDNVRGGFDLQRFRILDIVQDFPNLTTFIIKDLLHDSSACSPDIRRWTIIDDFNMQLILKYLTHLKYISIYGNLTYLTDSGITGLSPESIERMNSSKDYTIYSDDFNGVSFSSLKSLQVCCLEFLGTKVTDVSIQFGFNNLKNLKALTMGGAIQIDQSTVDFAKIILPDTIIVLKTCLKLSASQMDVNI